MPINAPPPTPLPPNALVPPGLDELVMEQFAGCNQKTTRVGVPDEQMFWSDGFMPLAPRNLRTLYDVGPPIFQLGVTDNRTINWFDFANIGNFTTGVCVLVLSDGSIQAVDMNTFGSGQIAGSPTIANPQSDNIALAQVGNAQAVIVTNQTNGYFIYDGLTLGTSSFHRPGETYAGGIVPTGISGNVVEAYQQRVWVANSNNFVASVAGSVIDFAAADGGVGITSNESNLRVRYTSFKSTNGFLYLVGDSSVQYISGVQTAGSPPVTTFTQQNADPEIGSSFPAAITTFGRDLILANSIGAYVVYGSTATKISDMVDNLWSAATIGSFKVSVGKAIVFGQRVFVILLPYFDLFTNQIQNKLLMWNGKQWWGASQSVVFTFIRSFEVNSNITLYGTDGRKIYPLFATASNALQKKVKSKLWDKPGYELVKTGNRFWALGQYNSITSPTITVTLDDENGSNVYNMGNTVAATGNVVFDPTQVGLQGSLAGMQLVTNCPDFQLISAKIGTTPYAYRG